MSDEFKMYYLFEEGEASLIIPIPKKEAKALEDSITSATDREDYTSISNDGLSIDIVNRIINQRLRCDRRGIEY